MSASGSTRTSTESPSRKETGDNNKTTDKPDPKGSEDASTQTFNFVPEQLPDEYVKTAVDKIIDGFKRYIVKAPPHPESVQRDVRLVASQMARYPLQTTSDKESKITPALISPEELRNLANLILRSQGIHGSALDQVQMWNYRGCVEGAIAELVNETVNYLTSD